jgi:hypothetical protein
MANKLTKDFKDTEKMPDLELNTGKSKGKTLIDNLWTLVVGAGSTVFKADISGIWLGAKKWKDGPFRVDMEGNVTAESISITGGSIVGISDIDAASLSGASLSTDTALGTSDTLIPSQKAVKSYVDTSISTVNTTIDNLLLLPYMLQSDSTTQAIADTDESQLITFDTDVYHSGITRTSASRFTIVTPGIYKLSYTATADSDTANKYIEIWIRVNGTDIDNSNTIKRMSTVNTEYVFSSSYILDLDEDDYFELVMYGDDTGVEIVATDADINPTRPACPSIIMTCNMISKG